MTSCLKDENGNGQMRAPHNTHTQCSAAQRSGAGCRTTNTDSIRVLREGNAGLRPGLDRQGVLVLALAARNGWWANRPCGPQEIQGAELSGLRQLQVHLWAPSPEA